MRTYTVLESFNFSGRGAAVVVDGEPTDLWTGKKTMIITTPEGGVLRSAASQEFALTSTPTPTDKVVFLLHDVTSSQVPIGSTVGLSA